MGNVGLKQDLVQLTTRAQNKLCPGRGTGAILNASPALFIHEVEMREHREHRQGNRSPLMVFWESLGNLPCLAYALTPLCFSG